MASDWFREPGWDLEDQREFERRLARARPDSRPQYLCIKAQALCGTGLLDAAGDLLRRAISDISAYEHERALCTELLGDIARKQGNRDQAEAHYRQVLARWPDLNGTTSMVEVKLAEIITEQTSDTAGAHEAMRLLRSRLDRRSMFNTDLFRLRLAMVHAAERLGDRETMREAARLALNLVGQGPQLPRHPTVGLVSTDEATLAILTSAANQ